jgi:hypothetical protein
VDKKRLEDMTIGDVLCDMHYGLSTDGLKNRAIATVIKFPAIDGHEFLGRQLPHDYLNKMLVMVGAPVRVGGYIRAVFAYSYDDRTFGVVQIMAEPCEA